MLQKQRLLRNRKVQTINTKIIQKRSEKNE